MHNKVDRVFPAGLEAREYPGGVWRLASAAEPGIEIILRSVDPEGRATLQGARATRISIEWRRAEAAVILLIDGTPRRIRARTAIVHEARPALYDALPLVKLDAAARRFWRRVFWLVRLPGGRRLLGLAARRAAGAGRRAAGRGGTGPG